MTTLYYGSLLFIVVLYIQYIWILARFGGPFLTLLTLVFYVFLLRFKLRLRYRSPETSRLCYFYFFRFSIIWNCQQNNDNGSYTRSNNFIVAILYNINISHLLQPLKFHLLTAFLSITYQL